MLELECDMLQSELWCKTSFPSRYAFARDWGPVAVARFVVPRRRLSLHSDAYPPSMATYVNTLHEQCRVRLFFNTTHVLLRFIHTLCFSLSTHYIAALLGVWRWTSILQPSEQTRRVTNVISVPKSKAMLLYLESPVSLDEHVNPICIPSM